LKIKFSFQPYQVEAVIFPAAAGTKAADSAAADGILLRAGQDTNSFLVITHNNHVFIFSTVPAGSEEAARGEGDVGVNITGSVVDPHLVYTNPDPDLTLWQ